MAAAAHAIRKKNKGASIDGNIKAAFDKFDADGSGDIDVSELTSALKELGMTVSQDQVTRIMAKYDTGGSRDSLDIDMFDTLVADLKGSRKSKTGGDPSSPSRRMGAAASATIAVPAKAVAPVVEKLCRPKQLPYQSSVLAFYTHPACVGFVAFIIIANFVVNILEKEIDPHGVVMPSLWKDLDLVFNWIFLFELVFNMYSVGGPFATFWNSGWNCFDTFIVSVGLLFMLQLIPEGSPLSKLKLLRAFRIFRIFKRIKSLVSATRFQPARPSILPRAVSPASTKAAAR